MLPVVDVSVAAPHRKRAATATNSPSTTCCRGVLFRWRRRVFIALMSGVVFVFLWMQYTMLSSRSDAIPNALSSTTSGGANNATPQRHSDHLRRPQHTLQPTTARPTDTTTATATAIEPMSDSQEARQAAVKEAMQFAWRNYEATSFGADEVDPVSGAARHDVWGGMACSMVDALDTLWIMDMKDEFFRARDYISKNLKFNHLGKTGTKLSIFETIIRELGGLLSAFDLSKDDIFKQKAIELMELLLPAFDAQEGVFYTYFNPQTHEKGFASWAHYNAYLADIGSLQLEMRYLTSITKDPKYQEMGDAFYGILQREGAYKQTGLFPVQYDPKTGKFVDQFTSISIGALGDSFYEYLLKVFIFSGKQKTDFFLRQLYDVAVDGMEKLLLQYSAKDELYYLQALELPSLTGVNRMDHLLCFMPGLLALGTLHDQDQDHAKSKRHLQLAEKIMDTCYQMYHRQATGLSPDIVSFPGMVVEDPKYRLRPETVESLFYMYRVTKKEKYRDMGWEIFQNLEKHAKVEHGYGAIHDVRQVPAEVESKMESFFLAETLKYHYLLQSPEHLIPLDKYVFNTEAHPLSILQSLEK